MCLVWRGGLSSWNIWTRSVFHSSLLRSSHLDMGSSSLLTITPGCSSIPSIQLELSSPAHSGMQLDRIKPAKPARPVSPGSPGSAGSAGVRGSGDLGQHRELRPCTSRTNAARWLDVERPSFFYTPGFSTSFLHITPSQRPVPGV